VTKKPTAKPKKAPRLLVPPRAWIRCAYCRQPYALRYVRNLMSMTTMTMRADWAWMRDCAPACRKRRKTNKAEIATSHEATP
jgi:hypothetical protein